MKKKMISLLLVLALAVGICPAAFATDAPQNYASEIQPREVLTLSKTQAVAVDGKHIARITVKYTVRSEPSNISGYYITGISSASIESVIGWTAVRNAKINQSGIVYAQNHQTAAVPVEYEASIGAGYSTYKDIINIDLRFD